MNGGDKNINCPRIFVPVLASTGIGGLRVSGEVWSLPWYLFLCRCFSVSRPSPSQLVMATLKDYRYSCVLRGLRAGGSEWWGWWWGPRGTKSFSGIIFCKTLVIWAGSLCDLVAELWGTGDQYTYCPQSPTGLGSFRSHLCSQRLFVIDSRGVTCSKSIREGPI